MRQQLCILGATGSIGRQTLDIVAQHPEKFEVLALSAHKQVDVCFDMVKQFLPQLVVMVDDEAARHLRQKISEHHFNTEVLTGEPALNQLASLPEVDTVVAGITGAAGLPSVLSAAKAGKKILLANKEALVMTGPLLMELIERHGAELVPLDSEHNAIFQCIQQPYTVGEYPKGVEKLILTASGGPFLDTPFETFETITPTQALKHPTWSMGMNISIDCATMFNKGLEVIEAHHLFSMPSSKIDVVVHPQSLVHSFVVYHDGSFLAQMGAHDMRIPISYGLGWPERLTNGAEQLDLPKVGAFDFRAPDTDKFPCLRLAYQALDAGGIMPVVLNASNEVARQAFIDHKIGFHEIPNVIEQVMNDTQNKTLNDIELVFEVDHQARLMAYDLIER